MQGAAYWSLQLGVVVYLINLVYFTKSYLALSTPAASVFAWASGPSDGIAANVSTLANELPFCQCWRYPNTQVCAQYAYTFQSEGPFGGYACVQLPVSQTVVNDNDKLFVLTTAKVCDSIIHGPLQCTLVGKDLLLLAWPHACTEGFSPYYQGTFPFCPDRWGTSFCICVHIEQVV